MPKVAVFRSLDREMDDSGILANFGKSDIIETFRKSGRFYFHSIQPLPRRRPHFLNKNAVKLQGSGFMVNHVSNTHEREDEGGST